MPPKKENKDLTWPNWPIKLRTSSSHEEGCLRDWAVATKRFEGKNNIEKIIAARVEWHKEPDGRMKMKETPGSEFEIKVDMVIKALGFDPEELPKLFDEEKLQVTKWGTIKTNFDTMETNIPGVFAAGDIIRGASLVVWAIKDGREAAKNIETFLEFKKRQKVA